MYWRDLCRFTKVITGSDVNEVTEGINQALADGITPKEILYDGLMHGMNIIGEKFTNNEAFVPEVLIAASAMNAGMEILKPKLIETGVESKVVLGTVKGDLHDIGKNLVKMMLEGADFEVVDLGTDVAPEAFVEALKENKPDIVGLSALLTTTMPQIEETIKAIEEAGLRNDVIVMIGGAPVTEKYANDIGADAYSKDVATAARVAKEKVS